ncbi:MAG: hypothetical protein GQ532_10430 [Methylomarinum sp.]|nr:hypothetical protein [Methylomarinum sp.]
MNYLTSKKQLGIGLIEVLIATVVIAIGLLAVASLQGGFLNSSGNSKTRSEALVLAEQKIEELRNNITLAQYDAIPNSAVAVADAGNPIAGSNASFTRSWVIDEGGTAERKNISVSVSWGNGADEKVNIVTEMTFVNPAKSAFIASESSSGTSAVPSPRQNASEDVDAASESVVGTNLDIVEDAGVTGTAGTSSDLAVDLPDNGGTLIVYQVAPGSHFYTATIGVASIEPGVIAVFLCNSGVCSHIQNHFGGVVHRIKGTVYSTSGNGLSNILVAWTSSDVHACYKGSITSSGGVDSMPYECVNAGNCNTSAAGTRTSSGAHAIDTGCFVDAVVSDDQINERNVGPGGEFGDVGLLGLDYQSPGQEQVCFLEDTTDPATSPLLNTSGNDVLNENYLFAVTKRLYITRKLKRNGSNNDHKSEGINRSYTNHNFFIVARGSGATAKEKCNTEVIANSKQIAPRDISRALNDGTANVVTAEAAYSGGTATAHTLTGNVTGSATKLRLFIPETGACYLNNALDKTTDATGYACVVSSSVANAEIIGSSNQHKNVDPSVFASCTKTANTTPGCHWLSDFTNSYGGGSSSCTTPWGTELADAASVDAYSASDCSTAISRTCSSGTLGGDSSAIYETSAACVSATANASCSSPWIGGPDITHGNSVNAFTASSVIFGATCPGAVTRTCNNGALSGDVNAVFQSCTVDAALCFVPTIDGDNTSNATQLAAVISKIEAEDLVAAGTLNASLPNQKVANQNPAGGIGVTCGSTVTFDYKQ